jgi:hypothetical protein
MTRSLAAGLPRPKFTVLTFMPFIYAQFLHVSSFSLLHEKAGMGLLPYFMEVASQAIKTKS